MDNKPRSGAKAGLTLVRILLLCTAAAMIVYGVSRGEVAVVLKKAVNLCLECIGLG